MSSAVVSGRERVSSGQPYVHNTFIEVRGRTGTDVKKQSRSRAKTSPGILENEDDEEYYEDEEPLSVPAMPWQPTRPIALSGTSVAPPSPTWASEPMSIPVAGSRLELPQEAMHGQRGRLDSTHSDRGQGKRRGRTNSRFSGGGLSPGNDGLGFMVPQTPDAFSMQSPYLPPGVSPFFGMPGMPGGALNPAGLLTGGVPGAGSGYIVQPGGGLGGLGGLPLMMAMGHVPPPPAQHLGGKGGGVGAPPQVAPPDKQICLSQLLPAGGVPGAKSEHSGKGATTLMLRNIPNNYQRDSLLSELDSHGFKACYDFFYLPIDFRNRCNMGYAFINMVNPQEAERFKQTYNGVQLTAFRSAKVCEVCDARVQGRWRNIEQYRNSAVMNMEEFYQPIIFECGVRAPFPKPTAVVKPLKLRPPRS